MVVCLGGKTRACCLWFVIALGISARAMAQLPSPAPEIAVGIARADSYPAHDATFPGGVRGIPDVVYWTPVGYRPLTLDLYLPPVSMERPAAGFPLVLYIHGGGWMGNDSRHNGAFVDFPSVLASLSARGYVVASVNYRLSSEAKFPAQIEDVKASIRWLRLNASKYGIDPARVMTWGVSAGGHLAGLAAVSGDVPALEPRAKLYMPAAKDDPITSDDLSDIVQGSVAWYGIFDMATIAEQARQDHAASRDVPDAAEWQLLGCFGNTKANEKQIAAASPVTYVNAKSPPMLLIVGTEDTTVPYHQTLEMADKLKSAGVKHQLMVLPGVNHSFLGKTPQQTRDAVLKALAATFQFIDQTIGNAAGTKH